MFQKFKQNHPQKSIAVAHVTALTNSKLRRDDEQVYKKADQNHVSELQLRLDREAEEAERWDGMS